MEQGKDNFGVKLRFREEKFRELFSANQFSLNVRISDAAVLVPLGVLLLDVVLDGGRRVADRAVVVTHPSARWLGRTLRRPLRLDSGTAVLAGWHDGRSSENFGGKFEIELFANFIVKSLSSRYPLVFHQLICVEK